MPEHEPAPPIGPVPRDREASELAQYKPRHADSPSVPLPPDPSLPCLPRAWDQLICWSEG